MGLGLTTRGKVYRNVAIADGHVPTLVRHRRYFMAAYSTTKGHTPQSGESAQQPLAAAVRFQTETGCMSSNRILI